MSKAPKKFVRGLSFDEAVDNYYEGIQQVALAKVNGSYSRGEVPPSLFKKSLDRWTAQRTTPDLIPFIDGQVVTVETYEQFIRNNISDMSEIYRRVALKSSPGGGRDAVKWAKVSKAHTNVTGSYEISAYESVVNEFKDNTKVIYTTVPPHQPLHEYAMEELKHFLYANDIGAPGGGAFKFLVVYEGESLRSAIPGRAQVLEKQSDGSFKGTTGGPLVFNFDSLYPHGKDKVIFSDFREVVEENIVANVTLDIEHLRSVAAESIELVIKGLQAVKSKVEKKLTQTSLSPVQRKVHEQIIKDLQAQLDNAHKNLGLAKKVGRVVATPLNQSITTEEFKTLIEHLPEEGGELGLNMLVYNKVTSSYDLTKVDIAHSVEYDFIPGLSKFNRGIASALEKSAKNSVEEALLFPSSPSPFTRVMHGILYKIFDEKGFLDAVKGRLGSSQKPRKIFLPLFKKTKGKTVAKPRTTLRANRSGKRGGSSRFQMPSTVNAPPQDNMLIGLNKEIKEEVMRRMVYPALQNRSGRFASSVRVLSAKENAAVTYTYQKSPYSVFSKANGKLPWNSRSERDPARIIDGAIRAIGLRRYGVVLRTEER